MIDQIKKILKQQESVLFAYLFGSHAEQAATTLSDIDIAVYLAEEDKSRAFVLKTDIYVQLSKALKQNKIDVVILNHCSNIILLDRIISTGVLILDTATPLREDYEQRALHKAIDFKTQRKMAMDI
ncbi:MAG: nucleotidyltransferase domain-containing protein [Desulfobacteraceae bacterium]|nr:MAG: nucleotidyltransferase domain-containing protein [Desulfobacteraceae bacterium]